MSVWFAVPSARPNGGTAALWKAKGYKVALFRDKPTSEDDLMEADAHYVMYGNYPGYAEATNRLVRRILEMDPDAEWIVGGGDDVEPDPNHSPEQIALECRDYFGALGIEHLDTSGGKFAQGSVEDWNRLATFGVMQPTGDRWGDDAMGRHRWPDAPAYIDRVCGSPWMGREFCRRMYQGHGPLFPGYRHMFEDEELQAVAERLGVLWQRRDLIQYHRHYAREGQAQPKHLEYVSGPEHWREAKALFESRKANGFPGHEPIS